MGRTYVGRIARVYEEVLTPADRAFIEQSIDKVSLRSIRSATHQRSIIAAFMDWIHKPLVDITDSDAEAYCQYIDTLTSPKTGKRLKCGAKKTIKYVLSGFFQRFVKYVRKTPELNATYPTLHNPFEDVEYVFTADPEGSLEDDETVTTQRIWTIDQVKQILVKLRQISLSSLERAPRGLFVLFLLLLFSGCRLSEVASIKLCNIDLEKRYFKSGLENGHRKSGKVVFCFPKVVAAHLAEYIADLQANWPENEWLFPGKNCTNSHYGVDSIGKRFNLTQFGFKVSSHTARRTLESFQLNPANNVPLHIVETLSCHVPTGTVMKHYNVITIDERRKLYDKYLPKEYKDLIWLCETL